MPLTDNAGSQFQEKLTVGEALPFVLASLAGNVSELDRNMVKTKLRCVSQIMNVGSVHSIPAYSYPNSEDPISATTIYMTANYLKLDIELFNKLSTEERTFSSAQQLTEAQRIVWGAVLHRALILSHEILGHNSTK